jgi:uncharacterized protein (TIGR02117 family)
LAFFVIFYFIAAFALSRITVDREKDSKEEVAIYIRTNGVHTDIVVPVHTDQMDWSKEVKYENTVLKDTSYKYLAVGWGDKGFYLQTPNWSDLKFSVAFNAAFGLSTTAIHATFHRQLSENESCRKILISREQYSQLINYIMAGFDKDANGHFMVIDTKANYGNSDAFYEATGRYNLFCTCNTWANLALKSCGQKCCVWTVFDKGIFMKYNY